MNVLILYNPNSTGSSEENARSLADTLKAKSYQGKVEVRATEHAGHGEEIAREYAKSGEEIVLISSSGDGGYHELVNGALSSESSRVVTGVLPAGNANDHRTATKQQTLADAVSEGNFTTIDTIKVTATIDGKPWQRYAHSYGGVGVTATAAKKLTEDRPNELTEKWIVAKALLAFKSVSLNVDGKTQHYSSLLFANIDRMSKIMKVSTDASITDGKFEVSVIRFRSRLRLLFYFLTAATVGLKGSDSVQRYAFTPVNRLLLQLDGEAYMLDAGHEVTVESIKQNLRCVR